MLAVVAQQWTGYTRERRSSILAQLVWEIRWDGPKSRTVEEPCCERRPHRHSREHRRQVPDIPRSGAELVQLYRDKDAVEKDFQTIKDVVKLRPVYHHTDPKVRAHVTLCILALLLERTLEQRLRRSSMPMTAPACFEQLPAVT